MDSSYVDVSEEGTNLKAAIGASVDSQSSLIMLISSLAASDLPKFAVIPELERGNIYLSSSQQSIITDYVSAGGILIVANCGDPKERSLLNDLFGWSLSQASCGGTSRVSDAYHFADGPSSLSSLNAISCS